MALVLAQSVNAATQRERKEATRRFMLTSKYTRSCDTHKVASYSRVVMRSARGA